MDGAMPLESFVPGPGMERDFRSALGRFTTGVCIVTAAYEDAGIGIVANSFTSVSMEPPLVLWSPAKASRRHDAFVSAETFSIHVLADTQEDIAQTLAKDAFGFDSLHWHMEPDRAPKLLGALARFDCTTYARHDAGDHTLILGEVQRVTVTEGQPLLYASGRYARFTNGG